MAKPLQSKKFDAIAKTIRQQKKLGIKFNADQLAADYQVSASTVRTIRRTKKWENYEAFNASRKERRLKPVEKQFAKSLEELELNPVEYVTKKQFTDAIDSLSGKAKEAKARADAAHERLNTHYERLNGYGRVLARIQQLKPRWFREN